MYLLVAVKMYHDFVVQALSSNPTAHMMGLHFFPIENAFAAERTDKVLPARECLFLSGESREVLEIYLPHSFRPVVTERRVIA